MSFSSEDHPNPNDPNDPLYYAPRSARSEANLRSKSTPQTKSERLRPTSSRSRFDEMLEEAFAKSTGHPLESQFVYDRPQPRVLLGVVGGIAAGISAAAIFAFVFLTWLQTPQKSEPSEVGLSTPASAATVQTPPEESQALLQKFVQFRKSQGSNNPESAVSEFRSLTQAGAAQKTPEESRTLLQKFEQWQKRQ